MKKLKIVLVVFIIAVISIFLYSRFKPKNLTPEEVSNLFIDGLVYNKQQEDFQKTFKNHKQYKNYMATDFPINSLEGLNFKIAEKDIKDLAKKLLVSYDKNLNKTSIELISATESNNIITATYNVKGFDLRPFLKIYIKNIFGELANLSINDVINIRNGNTKTTDIFFSALEKSIDEISISDKGKKVTFKFIKNGSQYELKDYSKSLQNFSLIFYTGFEQNTELQNFVEKYVNKATNSLFKN